MVQVSKTKTKKQKKAGEVLVRKGIEQGCWKMKREGAQESHKNKGNQVNTANEMTYVCGDYNKVTLNQS